MSDKQKPTNKYTQRQWDRTVGYGKVPKEFEWPDNPLEGGVDQNQKSSS